jgi:DNA adenine methylase
MLLSRLGNKKKVAKKLYQYFPPHRLRITLFFGAGGMFFNTPRSKFNVINDLDDDVTNLFLVVSSSPDELIEALTYTPISSSLLKHWRKEIPADPVLKAVRFLLLSNFTYLGKGDSIRFGVGDSKEKVIARIKQTHLNLGDAKIMNEDFRNVIRKISFYPTVLKKEEAFVYLDPVYLGTEHYYRVPKWTEEDTYDCFEIMSNEGIKAAMSEFDHPFILKEAKRRGFTVIPICNRRNIKNYKNEVLVINYEPHSLFSQSMP